MLLVDAAMLEEVVERVTGSTEGEGELLADAAMLEEVVERVTGSTEGEGELLADAAMLEEVVERVTGSTEGEGEGLVDAAVLEEVVERVGWDCACLACFLAAAFVCQPHEHGLFAEGLKREPCRHFLIEAIAAKTSLFDGFWPLPVNAGCPSARSINCSAYCLVPRK